MAPKASQRLVYLVTAVIVASMIGGFALAQLQLGQTNQSYQGSQTTTVTALPGLTWLATYLTAVNTSTPPYTTACPSGAPCDVTTTGAHLCVGTLGGTGGCNMGDFVEEISLTTIASHYFYPSAPPVIISLTVYVTGTPAPSIGGSTGTYSGPAFYLQQSASPSAEPILLDFDVGTSSSGPGVVTSISVVATT